MTLDASKPEDQVLVSELPSYIREGRAELNALEASEGYDFTVTDLMVSAGATALVIGTDLSTVAFEIVKITSLGAANIGQIRGGTEGQIKLFIFQDNQMAWVDGPKATGQLYLNHLPVLTSYNAQQNDVLALINIDGDGVSEYGYWKELYRTMAVK